MKIILIGLLMQNLFGFFTDFSFLDNPEEKQKDVKVDPLLLGLFSNYRDICKVDDKVSDATFTKNLQSICNVVVSSDLCQEIEKEHLLDCNSIESRSQLNFWDYYSGCARGVGDFFEGLLEFFWIFVDSAKERNILNILQSNRKVGEEYLKSIRLYIHSEYQKAYEKASGPNRKIKAIQAVTSSFSKQLFDAIVKWIDEKIDGFGCMSFQARTRITCALMSDFIIPAKGGSVIARHGSQRAAKIFNRTEKSLDVSDKGTKVLTQMESFLNALSKKIRIPLSAIGK